MEADNRDNPIPIFGPGNVEFLSEPVESGTLKTATPVNVLIGEEVVKARLKVLELDEQGFNRLGQVMNYQERYHIAIAEYRINEKLRMLIPSHVPKPLGLYVDKGTVGVLIEDVVGITLMKDNEAQVSLSLEQVEIFEKAIEIITNASIILDPDSVDPENLILGTRVNDEALRLVMIDIKELVNVDQMDDTEEDRAQCMNELRKMVR